MSEAVTRQPVHQALLFQWLRWRLLRNAGRTLVGQSLMRPLTILLVSAIVWVFVFAVSWAGFYFLQYEAKLPITGEIIGLLIDLMFLALGVLLVFSTGLILYGSLFASGETAFLLSRPLADDQVFAYKFQGAVAFSSWAFLLLGGPVLIAYGLVSAAPWHFYVVFLPLFFLGFVLLPGSLGAILCLLIVNLVPRRRRQLLWAVLLLLAALLGLWLWSLVQEARPSAAGLVGRETANRLLGRFSFARGVLLPTHWVARGLRASGKGSVGESLYYLSLVWSNGLVLYLGAAWTARRLYRRGFNLKATGGSIKRRPGGAWLDRALEAVLFLLNPRTRLLIVKDFRTFRRDPQQWAQVLIFTGLMLLYLVNIRRIFLHDITWNYQNGISLLNLCAIALLLCTYTGRFVYPLLSLEGRKFWVLGLLPLQREQLLWGKFGFATAGSLLIAGPLVVLSDLMLEMPPAAVCLHALTVLVLAAGLSGLSVGLGAAMPNFRESDPSKIAVGFGGTLNLVAGLGLLLLCVGLLAVPWHLQAARAESSPAIDVSWWLVGGSVALGLAVGAAAVALPLRLGIRALRSMEF
jgi:ABC-2 type transport system permease protein